MSTSPRVRFIHRVSGQLEVVSPLHMGTGTEIPGVDDVVQTDGAGELVIPGTGLAGALRARVPASLKALFGAESRSDSGRLSPAGQVLVDDAPAVSQDCSSVMIWHGVGINARTGAADPGVLYTRELVTPGTRFELSIEIEDATEPEANGIPDSDERKLTSAIVSLLESGLALGRSTTTGLGRVELRDAEVTCTYDLTTRAGMLNELAGQRQTITLPEAETGPSCGSAEIVLTIDWHPIGTIMCGVETEGAVSLLPRTLRRPGMDDENSAVRLVLPGAGIKGALRKRAELIARTVASTGGQPVESLRSLLADNQDERLGVVLPLFGRPAKETTADKKPVQEGTKAALTVESATGTGLIPADKWDELLRTLDTVGDNEAATEQARKAFRSAVDKLNTQLARPGIEFAVVDRVAIDRWTQGAATSRLFAALEPTRSTWGPLELRLDLSRFLDGKPCEADKAQKDREKMEDMVALLLLVIRDLANGWIPLGRGTRRGWGGVAVEEVKCRVGDALTDLDALGGDIPMPGSGSTGSAKQNKLIEQLVTAWFSRQEERSGGQHD